MVIRKEGLPQGAKRIMPPSKEMRGYDVDIAPPKLPYGPMNDLIRLMKGKWEIPSLAGLSLDELDSLAGMDAKQINEVINGWKSFCISATVGGMVVRPDLFGERRFGRQDKGAVMAWLTTKGILARISRLDDEGTKKVLDGAIRAFASLLGERSMKPWDTKKAKGLARVLTEYGLEFSLAQNPIIID